MANNTTKRTVVVTKAAAPQLPSQKLPTTTKAWTAPNGAKIANPGAGLGNANDMLLLGVLTQNVPLQQEAIESGATNWWDAYRLSVILYGDKPPIYAKYPPQLREQYPQLFGDPDKLAIASRLSESYSPLELAWNWLENSPVPADA